MLRGTEIVKDWSGPVAGEAVLDYEDRHRRRISLRMEDGVPFLLDLADVPDIRDGDGIALSSGEYVLVRAASEALLEIRTSDPRQLARIAWHIGNRHLAAEIGMGFIRIRADHVIADMVVQLGGEIRSLEAPFNPEGGAYARTSHGQSHG